VVLADAEHVEPHLVGELDLLQQIAQPLGARHGASGGGVGVVSAKV
jgi:hypothetical protein